MSDKKRDLVPIAAIAIFLVIIIILCVVRLNERKSENAQNNAAVTENAEILESSRAETETQSESRTDAAAETETAAREEASAIEQESEEASVENEIPSGKTKEKPAERNAAGARTISGNDPFAAAEGVNKTNEEMLMEMSAYWEQDNMTAVSDLAHLAWFMKMSDSIKDENTFYYYGERNAAGQPEGKGIACYEDNAYYYGDWAAGKRSGIGEWVRYYVYYDDDTSSDRAYNLHMYMGEWANDMPNGEGQEHYDLDMSKAAKQERYLQNVIGTFRDGLYSGEMYLTTLNWDGNQEEWNGFAEEGIWSPYGAATSWKEVPVCQDVDDDDNFLWIAVKNNRDRGIAELCP